MTPPNALAERLRSDTKALHIQTERAGLMPAMLRGELAREGYCALLRNLHALYTALETALTQHATHAEVAPVVFPALFRQAALADDLAALHGADWSGGIGLQAATMAYVERLKALASAQPALLAAHAYVRYLGDLNGGQALGKIVSRAYAPEGGRGLRFYDFGTAEAVREQVRRFRSGLAALPVDALRIDALVAEARWAFTQHAELFEQLAGTRREAAA
jgi:heme oxygenase (biliverdin-producing, ferredoxin)